MKKRDRGNRRGDIGCYVYRHVRHDKNEVFYVGIGTGYNYQRAYQKKGRRSHWDRIVAKTDYTVEIILDRLTREQAQEKEKEFIALYRRVKDGGTLCNLTLGGDGCVGLAGELSPNYGKKYPKERVDNMKAAQKKAITPELIKRISDAAKCRPPVSEETRRKLSESGKRQVYSEERRRAISERQKNKKQ